MNFRSKRWLLTINSRFHTIGKDSNEFIATS
jgi:hypothetical protein